MTDSEKEKEKNLRMAFEEANRYLRHLDSFQWAISALLLAGTGFAIKFALEADGKNWKIILLGIAIIILWHWYRSFFKDVLLKIQYYMNKANEIETQLNIDIIPLPLKNIQDILSETTFPIDVICKFSKVKKRSFPTIMVNCIFLIDSIWIFFIVRCLYLNRFELCGITKEIYHLMCI
jgi:hypothetical protein